MTKAVQAWWASLIVWALLMVGIAHVLCGCSAASFKEQYQKTPVQATSRSEGRNTYHYSHNGTTYVMMRDGQGRLQVVGVTK